MIKISQNITQEIKLSLFTGLSIVLSSCNQSTSKPYVPESNGNINSLTVVMDEKYWSGELVAQQ